MYQRAVAEMLLDERRVVLDTLNRGINEALSDPEARARIVKFNLEPMGGTRDEFDRTVRSQITRWAGVIKTAGIEPD